MKLFGLCELYGELSEHFAGRLNLGPMDAGFGRYAMSGFPFILNFRIMEMNFAGVKDGAVRLCPVWSL